MKARRNARPGVEPLEGRALLSHVALGASPRGTAALTAPNPPPPDPTTPTQLSGNLSGRYLIQQSNRTGAAVVFPVGGGTIDGARVDRVTGRITARVGGEATLAVRQGTAMLIASATVPEDFTPSQPTTLDYTVTRATGRFRGLSGHTGVASLMLTPSTVRPTQGNFSATINS